MPVVPKADAGAVPSALAAGLARERNGDVVWLCLSAGVWPAGRKVENGRVPVWGAAGVLCADLNGELAGASAAGAGVLKADPGWFCPAPENADGCLGLYSEVGRSAAPVAAA